MTITLTPEEAEAVRQALEHFNAYLYSQRRETEIHRRLEKLFAKLATEKK